MIKEQGIVEKIINQKAVVRVMQTSACDHCKDRGSCELSDRSMMVEVNNDAHAGVGDQVELSMPEGAVIKLSLIVYLFPVIALVIGAFLGDALGPTLHIENSVTAVIGGALGMTIVFLAVKIYEKGEKYRGRYQIHMNRILVRAKYPAGGDTI